jgi:hypothetical protein
MTLEAERITREAERPVITRVDVTVRTVQEARADAREAQRRTDVALKVALVSLIWLTSVPFLMVWDLAGSGRGTAGHSLAAVLAVVLPFVCAVIATRNRLFVLGGGYVVVTLAMVLPALGIARAGG